MNRYPQVNGLSHTYASRLFPNHVADGPWTVTGSGIPQAERDAQPAARK
jgi:hypothetical protein